MQDQVSIHLRDRSFLVCHYKPRVKEILHFFQELTTVFQISSQNVCSIASTQQCTNAAKLLWGSEGVSAQSRSCPLAPLSPDMGCTVPWGAAEMRHRTVGGKGWTWPASFSSRVKERGYLTTKQISNSWVLMVPANPGQRVAEPQEGRAGWQGASPCMCPSTA